MSNKMLYKGVNPNISFLMFNENSKDIEIKGEYSVLFIMQGYAEADLDGRRFIVSSPSFVCLNNNQCFKIIKSKNIFVKIILFEPTFINKNMTYENIESKLFNNLCDKHDFFRLEPFTSYLLTDTYITGVSPELSRRVDALYSSCYFEYANKPDWYWSCRTRSNFMDLLHIIERLHFNKKKPSDNKMHDFEIIEGFDDIQEILLFIWSNYQDTDLSVSMLCEIKSIDQSTLNRRFKKITNTTVCEYIQSYRLYIASGKLRFTELTIQEITNQCGFLSAAYFTKVFKKRFGLPPNKFRKQVVCERKTFFNN